MKSCFNFLITRALGILALTVAGTFSSGAAPFVLNPIADALVTTGGSADPLGASNYGGAGALSIAAGDLGKGEFQSVLKFDLSSAKQSFDTQFGTGLWTIQSITLQLTSTLNNNTSFFNTTAAGNFNISLMQNNSWAEGSGNPMSPTTDGITFDTLQSSFVNNTLDQVLGGFSFNGASSGASAYTLTLSSGLVSDLETGSDASLRLSAADSVVSYLANSRTGGSTANHPELIITVIPEPSTTTLGATALAAVLFWQLATGRGGKMQMEK